MATNVGGGTYSVSEIVDKTLIAKKPVKVFDDAEMTKYLRTVQPGSPVGVVYSWVIDDTDGSVVWMIYGKFGNFIWAKHEAGVFEPPVLAKSQEEIKKEQEEANKSLFDKISGTVKGLVITGISAYVIKELAQTYIAKKN